MRGRATARPVFRGRVAWWPLGGLGGGGPASTSSSRAIASWAASGSRTTSSRLLEGLPQQPVGAAGHLDHDGSIGELLDHGVLLASPAGALGGDPDPGDVGRRDLAPRATLLDRGDLLDLRAGLEALLRDLGLLDPIEAEVTDVLAPAVIGGDVPALRSVGEAVGLDLPLGELVLVLLV